MSLAHSQPPLHGCVTRAAVPQAFLSLVCGQPAFWDADSLRRTPLQVPAAAVLERPEAVPV